MAFQSVFAREFTISGFVQEGERLIGVNIFDPECSVGKRPLDIQTVLDRVIQQAILQPLFDSDFPESSFGLLPYRSAHDAVKRVRAILDTGYSLVVDIYFIQLPERVNRTYI